MNWIAIAAWTLLVISISHGMSAVFGKGDWADKLVHLIATTWLIVVTVHLWGLK
jgi:hypothetical protein